MEENQTNNTTENADKESPVEKRRIVGVRFSSAGKVYSFDAVEFDLKLHELVAVEGEKGTVIGKISYPVTELSAKQVATNIKKVVRKANEEDTERYNKNKEEAASAFKICQKKIVEHGLTMKLVDVDVLTGDAKAIFYFTAEERVDFRALVKDLATTMHMRIEMRQIGARDAAKNIGSVGPCGFVCCCKQHLREFKSIAIQMAKNQGLSPNPAKLTGMCGKLKCCMLYENEMYSKLRRQLPTIGSEVSTPRGNGVVTSLDVPRKLVQVRIEEINEDVRLEAKDVKVTKKRERRDKKKNRENNNNKDGENNNKRE